MIGVHESLRILRIDAEKHWIGAGENRMSEHTGHGSCVWRSTAVRAGDAK